MTQFFTNVQKSNTGGNLKIVRPFQKSFFLIFLKCIYTLYILCVLRFLIIYVCLKFKRSNTLFFLSLFLKNLVAAMLFPLFSKIKFRRNIHKYLRHMLLFFKRSSRPEMFCKKDVLRNFGKFTGKHLCQNLFFNKGAG